MAVAAPDRLYYTDSDEANELLAADPLALLIGFALDQQVTVPTAFAGPLKIKQRLGTLEIAPATRPRSRPPSARSRRCIASPARWRRACRTWHALVEDEYGGDASRLWSEASDSDDLRKRIAALPGFGEMKIKALSAVLWKRFGVKAAEGLARASDARRRRLPRGARRLPGEEAGAQSEDARAAVLRPRPPVTAYVTREHPETGLDELLVFDFPDAPDFSAVVPGGGIEEGESVEETAIREVMEETGIEAEFVRVVGVGDDPVGHYVQLRPTKLLPEAWEHIREDGPVLCRWIPVRADAEVWGLRGDFIPRSCASASSATSRAAASCSSSSTRA